MMDLALTKYYHRKFQAVDVEKEVSLEVSLNIRGAVLDRGYAEIALVLPESVNDGIEFPSQI